MDSILLTPNVECIIESLKGNDQITQRLVQMGVLPGSRLHVVRVGPMGKTVEVIIDHSESIALRSTELKALNCKVTALPLIAVKSRKKLYRIRNFLGGWGFIQKMQSRGLFISDIIRLKERDGYELISKDHRVVRIGRGEAEKIIVEPVNE
jgi:Fe2+ transport system protein FeoA